MIMTARFLKSYEPNPHSHLYILYVVLTVRKRRDIEW